MRHVPDGHPVRAARGILVRALLALLLFAWPVHALGPTAINPLLPVHARATSLLDGGNFERLRILDDAAQTVELHATATLPRVQCGRSIHPGDAWRVRTSLLHHTQQWLIALVLLAAVPVRSERMRAAWCAIAAPLVFAQQFITLPVLLAAGIDDVACAGRVAPGWMAQLPPTPLLAADAVLHNGGLWLLTAVLLAVSWWFAHVLADALSRVSRPSPARHGCRRAAATRP